MAQFTMTVNLDNDAFQGSDQELARIIAEVSKKVGKGFLDGSLLDINGQAVGCFSVDLDEEEEEEDEEEEDEDEESDWEHDYKNATRPNVN
jgi:hypothetical protein